MQTIIFDLGNVLINWNPRNVYAKYMTDQEMDFFLSEVCNMKWNALMDSGVTFEEGTNRLIKLYPEHSEMILKYWKEWPSMIGGAIEGSIKIMDELRQSGYPLYALTNWSMETFPPMLEKFDFLTGFIDIVISAEEKVCKPDKKLYQILLDKHQIEPTNSIFIDDSIANVKTAADLGMTAVHFQSASQLLIELKKHLPDFGLK